MFHESSGDPFREFVGVSIASLTFTVDVDVDDPAF